MAKLMILLGCQLLLSLALAETQVLEFGFLERGNVACNASIELPPPTPNEPENPALEAGGVPCNARLVLSILEGGDNAATHIGVEMAVKKMTLSDADGDVNRYAAVGFSDGPGMLDTTVAECFVPDADAEPTVVRLGVVNATSRQAFNLIADHDAVLTLVVANADGGNIDDYYHCKFEYRIAKPEGHTENAQLRDLSELHSVLMAFGTAPALSADTATTCHPEPLPDVLESCRGKYHSQKGSITFSLTPDEEYTQYKVEEGKFVNETTSLVVETTPASDPETTTGAAAAGLSLLAVALLALLAPLLP